jgi:DNA-binding NarL/FixJ family response regulator
MLNAYIADDHHLFIEGIKSLLRDSADVKIVGEAENGAKLLELLSNQEVDVVLMDINMPVLSGLETTKKVKQLYPSVKVLALTMFDDTLHISEMMKAGASGYLLKNAGKEELIDAIIKVCRGEKYVSNDVSVKLIERMFTNEQDLKSDQPNNINPNVRKAELTKRELEIIKLIAQEMTNNEIAAHLNNSPMTIITHRKNLLRKIGVKNTAGLIKYAMNNGLLD